MKRWTIGHNWRRAQLVKDTRLPPTPSLSISRRHMKILQRGEESDTCGRTLPKCSSIFLPSPHLAALRHAWAAKRWRRDTRSKIYIQRLGEIFCCWRSTLRRHLCDRRWKSYMPDSQSGSTRLIASYLSFLNGKSVLCLQDLSQDPSPSRLHTAPRSRVINSACQKALLADFRRSKSFCCSLTCGTRGGWGTF